MLHLSVHDGVAALPGAHRGLIDDAVKEQIGDSLDIDAALEPGHPEEHRWDYLLGHAPTEAVIALESHTASDSEVSVLIAKKQAASRQLRAHLRDGVRPVAWIWVTEGRVGFARSERAARRLDQAGITFANRRVLPKHLP